MNTIFYSIFADNSHDKYDELKFAVKAKPEYIIGLKSKGMSISHFTERTVETEHFYINYFDNNGNSLQLEYEDGWKIYDINDPEGYHFVLTLKIRDPFGKVKTFGDNYKDDFQRKFYNSIDHLILLKNIFDNLKNYKDWDDLLNKAKFNSKNEPESIRQVF